MGFVRVPQKSDLLWIKESELLEHLRAEAYGNQQPSSGWRDTPTREGSETIPQGSRGQAAPKYSCPGRGR